MDSAAFEQKLRDDGFVEIETKVYEPRPANGDHGHHFSVLGLVLDGAFSDTRGRYGRGDIALADEDVDHSPVAENDRPCICLAITDAPLRLTGSYRQFFSEFIGR